MLQLSAEGLPALDLDDITEGFVCEDWGLGPPAIRQVVENRVKANGTLDWTRYTGSRSVTFRIVVFANAALGLSVQGQLDRLARYCRPDLRPILTWTFPGDDERMVVMRANPGLDAPFSTNAYDSVRVGMSFVVPDSVVWATTDQTVAIEATSAAEEGRSYNEIEIVTNPNLQNLVLSNEQASIETGSTTPAGAAASWIFAGAPMVVARDPSTARDGVSSLRISRSDATVGQATAFAANAAGTGRYDIPVTPGNTYLFMASVKAPAGTTTAFIALSNSAAAGEVKSYLTADDTWRDVVASGIIPSTITAARLYVRADNIPAGTGVNVDRVALYDQGPPTWVLPSLSPGDLLSDDQASIEAGSTTPANSCAGWATANNAGGAATAANIKINRSTAQALDGLSSLYVTRTAGATGDGGVAPCDANGTIVNLPATENRRYRFQASVFSPLARTISLWVRCYDAAGTLISTDADVYVPIPVPANTWSTVLRDITTPPGTVGIRPIVIATLALGDVIYLDNLSARDLPVPPPFYLPSQGGGGGPTGLWGRVYDRKYPHTIPPNVEVINAGQVAVPWVAKVFGPCTNPRLINDSTGEGLYFTAGGGLSLKSDEVLILNSALKTATVDNANVYSKLDIAKSRWWVLAPGENRVRYYPDTAAVGANCDLTWRTGWL